MPNDLTIWPMSACFVPAGDRPPGLRSRGPGGAVIGSTLVSSQQ